MVRARAFGGRPEFHCAAVMNDHGVENDNQEVLTDCGFVTILMDTEYLKSVSAFDLISGVMFR